MSFVDFLFVHKLLVIVSFVFIYIYIYLLALFELSEALCHCVLFKDIDRLSLIWNLLVSFLPAQAH